jgi:UDP-N-acetylglucosamine 2-epimerase (hydrolysing)
MIKNRKKIVFLTGTRADFGKLKSLISITQNSSHFDVHIFVTGMHLNPLYGLTGGEIIKCGFQNIFEFKNHISAEYMDRTLAKTIEGFSKYIDKLKPDMIIVHGDRIETLAGAIVGSLNNILVTHIEGGELSGTIDGLIRHAVSKMSHIHLVSNQEAKKRLIQLGELSSTIFIIGSPDLDLMNPEKLPSLNEVRKQYEVNFQSFSIAMLHPVTTEYENTRKNAKHFINALISSGDNFIVIYPNNDLGSLQILTEIERLKDNNKFKVYPSLRFEYFLTFLKNADYIVGNSSAGIREAAYYGTPTVDIGSRQYDRLKLESIFHADDIDNSILRAISKAKNYICKVELENHFGNGESDKMFLKLLKGKSIWLIKQQKKFQDISSE